MGSTYLLELTDTELTRYRLMAERAREEEAELWALAGIAAGAAVADVGCGPGALSAELAVAVGPQGSVTAVDQDHQAVTRARELLVRRGIDNVSVRHGEATATGIAGGSINAVVIRHVLAHNGGREQAIVEHAASLLRPGGSVFLLDVDLTAQRWAPDDPDLTDLQERYIELHRTRGNDPTVGLGLGGLLARAGLEVLEHRGWYSIFTTTPDLRPPAWVARKAMVAAGIASADDIERWRATLDRAHHSPLPQKVFVASFAAIGRRS